MLDANLLRSLLFFALWLSLWLGFLAGQAAQILHRAHLKSQSVGTAGTGWCAAHNKGWNPGKGYCLQCLPDEQEWREMLEKKQKY